MADWRAVEDESHPNRVMMVDLDLFRAFTAPTFRVRVMQLCGPGSDFLTNYDRQYWPSVIFAGVRLATAVRWLNKMGWGPYRALRTGDSYEWPPGSAERRVLAPYWVSDLGPLRLRLKGRCWIEDPARPATLVCGPYDPVDLPARVKRAAEEALDAARARLRPTPRRRKRERTT